ncbi:MAG: CopD family protein [Candidatus Eisenbacteria bacterium]
MALTLMLCPPDAAMALPDYAVETGLACAGCHEDGADAGPLTEQGIAFLAAGHVLPEEVQGPSELELWVRGLVRYLHLVAGVVWFGAIAYIHLFTKPKSLVKGLPRAEMRLGWGSIIVMASTGTLLTVWKVGSAEELWTTFFGAVWMVKVATFLALVVIATVATTALNRRMRRDASEEGGPGACGHIRFAFEGTLYDATDSRWWKEGVHGGKHRAGTDLTAAMADAPHGPEVLDRVTAVGRVPHGCCATAPRAARAFIVLAYVNLALIAIVLFCVSFWTWGPAVVG